MTTTFKDEFIENKKNIKIPLLQRDYVQGGREDVIRPFLEQLNSAVRNKTEKIDLNYIYGYKDDDSTAIIPIDGQQRLITLWLLHLYIYSKTSKEYPVKLNFECKEFADSFCEQLKGNLRDFINENGDRGVCLKEKIIDANWFVNGWLLDVTVVNMLNTLNLIDEYESKEKLPDNPIFENIVFEFLNIKDSNIDDDVYIKMNGRGRPLSYFENLKSWMDEQVKKEEDFGKEWENKMDNEWTDFFWKNRNTKQLHPEEIDDEQVRLFYSLLILYWKINDSKEKNDDLFSSLQSGRMISLYQIETSKLFDSKVFHFISESLDVLCEISDYINNNIRNVVGVLISDITEATILYEIVLKEATYSSSLPLLYAMIKTPNLYRRDSIFRWMRLWINIVHNSDIRQENLGRFCETVDKICEEVENGNSSDSDVLYSVLSKFSWSEGMGIAKDQFYEEIAKAKQILQGKECDKPKDDKRSWEEIIIDAEKYAFFKGAIRFLFQNEKGEPCWEKFDAKWENAKKYFDENGVKKEYQEDALLLRALLSRLPKVLETWVGNKAKFWHDMLLNKDYCDVINELLTIDELKVSDECNIEWIKNKNLLSILLDSWDGECHILSGWSGCYILTHYEKRTNNNTIVVVGRNESSLKDIINIRNTQIKDKDTDTGFYYGGDFHFSYNEKKFQWRLHGCVRIITGFDKCTPILRDEKEPDGESNWYCFSVSPEMIKDPHLFMKKLDCLIAQAYPDSDKSICAECQEKICKSTSE